MTIGKISASPMAFHPRRPPRRNDTSAKPSRSTSRATTEATAGDHIRAQIHDISPVMMTIASNTAVSGTRRAKYMASPRRAALRRSGGESVAASGMINSLFDGAQARCEAPPPLCTYSVTMTEVGRWAHDTYVLFITNLAKTQAGLYGRWVASIHRAAEKAHSRKLGFRYTQF